MLLCACTLVSRVCHSDVGYDVNGFLEKNRDTLFGDLIATSQSSKLKLLRDIFPDECVITPV